MAHPRNRIRPPKLRLSAPLGNPKSIPTETALINGFYETHPIVYGEEAYGFAKTGQTICNVTDAKIIKLFVDDEPFWLPDANLLSYDRRLNMKSATLDRDILGRRLLESTSGSLPGVWSLSPTDTSPPSPTA